MKETKRINGFEFVIADKGMLQIGFLRYSVYLNSKHLGSACDMEDAERIIQRYLCCGWKPRPNWEERLLAGMVETLGKERAYREFFHKSDDSAQKIVSGI